MRPWRRKETKGHFSRDASAAIEHLGERYTRYANVLCQVRYIHAFQVGAQHAARMSRAVRFSGHIVLSVVILIVHEDRVLAVESEGQAPVAIYPN